MFAFYIFDFMFVFALVHLQFFFDGFISVLNLVYSFDDLRGITNLLFTKTTIGLCVVGSSILFSPLAIEFHMVDLVKDFEIMSRVSQLIPTTYHYYGHTKSTRSAGSVFQKIGFLELC